MTHDDAVNFFEEQQRNWAARDAAALTASHTDDATIISPIFRTVKGHQEILESYRTLFTTFPDWTYVAEPALVDGTKVAQPFIVSATHVHDFMGMPGSNRKFEIQGVILYEMRDGLIAHELRCYDFTGLLIQLGVLRGKPARP